MTNENESDATSTTKPEQSVAGEAQEVDAGELHDGEPNEADASEAEAGDLHEADASEADASAGETEASATALCELMPQIVTAREADVVELALDWRATGSRYRTECAHEMLELFDIDPPLELGIARVGEERLDVHVKIPVGTMIADLDRKLHIVRGDILVLARRLEAGLRALADEVVAAGDRYPGTFPIVGSEGWKLDQLCTTYVATKGLRDRLAREAFQRRGRNA